MSLLPQMGEDAERKLRAELADWDESRLIAKTVKAPGLAEDIAARQILEERRRKAESGRHAAVLDELRKPQWKTPGFWLAAVAAVTGCISVYPILWPKTDTPPSAATPKPAASTPLGGSTPASSQPLISQPSPSSPR